MDLTGRPYLATLEDITFRPCNSATANAAQHCRLRKLSVQRWRLWPDPGEWRLARRKTRVEFAPHLQRCARMIEGIGHDVKSPAVAQAPYFNGFQSGARAMVMPAKGKRFKMIHIDAGGKQDSCARLPGAKTEIRIVQGNRECLVKPAKRLEQRAPHEKTGGGHSTHLPIKTCEALRAGIIRPRKTEGVLAKIA
jgi:hypothetical protein